MQHEKNDVNNAADTAFSGLDDILSLYDCYTIVTILF